MGNASGIIQLAGFAVGSTDGDSPMPGGVPSGQGGISAGDSAMTGGDPSEVGGVASGDSPMTGGTPSQTGGVQPGDSPMTGGVPAESGGVQPGDSPMTGGQTTEALVGNVGGRPVDGSERMAQGGLGVRINGAAFSEREEVDYVSDMPGLELSGQDIAAPLPDARAEATFRVAGEVEVARLTLVPGAAPATQIVYTPNGPANTFIPTRVLAVAQDVSGVVTQPEIDLRKTSLGDVLPQVALGFTATGQANEFPCAPNRLAVFNGEDLTLGVPVAGSATTYTVRLSILGRVLPA